MSIHTQTSNQSSSVSITPGYHTYGVLTLPSANAVSFYVDNNLVHTYADSLPAPMMILMGLQLGNASMGWISGPVPANWPGGIDGPNTADMDVDWVHVWTP
jgi:beta-glucanase (GH16 family)